MENFIWVWPLLSLPVMAVFFGIYAATRSQGVSLWRSAAKCGATFTAVMTAVIGAVLQDRGAQGWLLVLALALCCAADFAIERSFIAGVVGFALAHAAFIAYILLAAHPVWASLPLGAALFAAAFAVSDVFVAKDALSSATDRQRNGALLLYYLAVYAMAFVQL